MLGGFLLPGILSMAFAMIWYTAFGQCDTTRLAQELTEMEALIWSDYPKAIARVEGLVDQYTIAPGWCYARALAGLGKTQWTNGDYQAALVTLNHAIMQAALANDRETIARAHHVIGNNYYFQGYYDSAEEHFIESKKIFDELKHSTGQIEVLHDIALMYHRQGNFAKSLRYLLQLESLKEAEPNFVHYVGDFTGISNYFIDTLYYRGIIADETRLLRKFKEEENSAGVYQSLINLSVAYRELGDHRRAARYAAHGSAVMSSTGYYPFWYLAAREYGLAGMRDSCFYFHQLALKELPRATRIKVAITYERIAESFRFFHQPDSSLKYYRIAFNLNKAMNNRLSIAALHGELASAYADLGQRELAEQHLLAGVELARKVSVKHTSTLYAFGKDFYEIDNPGRSLFYARLHEKLLDSINRNENAMELLRLQAQLETNRKERELEATRLKLRNRTIILASFALITALSTIFATVFFLQRKRIKRQNTQLNERNHEQEALVQEIHHRVKNNLQYIVSLLSLQAQSASTVELSNHIEEIKNRIMTMGLIHQKLYKAQEISRVEAGPFINELVTNVLTVFPSRVPVKRTVSVDPIQLDIDTAITLGLLINELTTNAVKHALSLHDAPEVILALHRGGRELTLSMQDNGPGFRFPGNGTGFGTKLIQLLVKKLVGVLHQKNLNTIEITMPFGHPVSKGVHEAEKV